MEGSHRPSRVDPVRTARTQKFFASFFKKEAFAFRPRYTPGFAAR
jgi:hypothetical protein